jgi:hypothetical protein
MKIGQISGRLHESQMALRVVLLTATFAAGLATGQGFPTADASGPVARSGSLQGGVARQAPPACFVSPALDTSKPYLTIQHGVIVVPGR